MQTVLTIAIDSIALTAAAYLAIGFALGLANIWQQTARQIPTSHSLPLDSEVIAEAVDLADLPPLLIDCDWSAMSPFDLRKACQQQGVKWRNANGKNRHLTKPQMIAVLSV